MAAIVDVTYTNFTQDQRAAFEYAKNVWERLLTSTVVIRINATFGANTLNGFMGMCVPNGVINSRGIQLDTWYVSALADALGGADVQPGQYDMDIQFSSILYNWYFGLDGRPGPTQYDFVTVALHEICHGLGFVGLCNSDDSGGSYSRITADEVALFFEPSFPFPALDGKPGIFYRNCFLPPKYPSLTDTECFPNPSANLAGAFVGGYGVVSVTGRSIGGETLGYPVYTPMSFQFGTSMDHFDDNNSLMAHSVGYERAIHVPGDDVKNVLRGMGWTVAWNIER